MNQGPKQPSRSLRQADLARSLANLLNRALGGLVALVFTVSMISISGCGGSDKKYKIPVDAPELKPFAPPADEEFEESNADEWAEEVGDDGDDDDDDDDDESAPSTQQTTQPSPKSN